MISKLTAVSALEDIHHLEGLWYDNRTDIQVEIDDHRKGVKVREITRYRKHKWDTYFSMGRGVYDNCNGSVLIVLDRGLIEWRPFRSRRSIFLNRVTRNRYNQDSQRWDDHGWSYHTDARNRYSPSDYCGDWYSARHREYLEIREFREGFRARRPGGDWVVYERDRDNRFSDRRGNIYYFDESGSLCWQSRDGKRLINFRKR